MPNWILLKPTTTPTPAALWSLLSNVVGGPLAVPEATEDSEAVAVHEAAEGLETRVDSVETTGAGAEEIDEVSAIETDTVEIGTDANNDGTGETGTTATVASTEGIGTETGIGNGETGTAIIAGIAGTVDGTTDGLTEAGSPDGMVAGTTAGVPGSNVDGSEETNTGIAVTADGFDVNAGSDVTADGIDVSVGSDATADGTEETADGVVNGIGATVASIEETGTVAIDNGIEETDVGIEEIAKPSVDAVLVVQVAVVVAVGANLLQVSPLFVRLNHLLC